MEGDRNGGAGRRGHSVRIEREFYGRRREAGDGVDEGGPLLGLGMSSRRMRAGS